MRIARARGEGGGLAEDAEDRGCAYILDDRAWCEAACQPGSSYCPTHHALCHVPPGTRAERRALREAEALAKAVGGRRGRAGRLPPDPFLRRLDRIARHFSCGESSCFVRDGDRQ